MTAPLTPGAYLKARRCAAHLDVDDVAFNLVCDPRQPEHARAEWLRLIEADVQPASFATIVALQEVFAFDLDVLAQLQAIALGIGSLDGPPRLCRICAASGAPWAEADLCHACHHPAPAQVAA